MQNFFDVHNPIRYEVSNKQPTQKLPTPNKDHPVCDRYNEAYDSFSQNPQPPRLIYFI